MEKIASMSREKLYTMYCEHQKKKRRAIMKQIFDDIRKLVVEKNEQGDTYCTIVLDNEIDEDTTMNIVYNVKMLFNDSTILSSYDSERKAYCISVDWAMPTYVVTKEDAFARKVLCIIL